MEDSVCHLENLGYCNYKTQSNFSRKKHPKVVKDSKFQYIVDLKEAVQICILITLGTGTRRLLMKKVEVEKFENFTKEGIHQLTATVQHLSEKILP